MPATLPRVWLDRDEADELKRYAWRFCSCVQMDEVSRLEITLMCSGTSH